MPLWCNADDLGLGKRLSADLLMDSTRGGKSLEKDISEAHSLHLEWNVSLQQDTAIPLASHLADTLSQESL